jgi:hypothetical protein
MKIIEILVGDQENPIGDTFVPPDHIPDQDLMARIANAFTQDGAVKLLSDLDLLGQPLEPDHTFPARRNGARTQAPSDVHPAKFFRNRGTGLYPR